MFQIRRSRATWLVLAAGLVLGCGSDNGGAPVMVQDPAPAPLDEASSDNMPNSPKMKAKFPKSGNPR